MRSFPLLPLVLSVFLLSCSPSQADHSYGHEKPHVRRRHTDNIKYKRDGSAVFTYFVDGQGACGAMNTPNDFIVALNSAEYDDGAHCFEMITININGKTAQAQITDKCASCSVGGLDFSSGLFEYFAPLSEGELYGSWSYNSDMTTSSSIPPTTSSPSWTPVTTVATTTSSSTASSTSSTSTVVSSPTSTVSTVPTSTSQDPQMITQIDLVLLELGALLQASFKVEN